MQGERVEVIPDGYVALPLAARTFNVKPNTLNAAAVRDGAVRYCRHVPKGKKRAGIYVNVKDCRAKYVGEIINHELYMTVSEAAKRAGVNRGTVEGLVSWGTIPHKIAQRPSGGSPIRWVKWSDVASEVKKNKSTEDVRTLAGMGMSRQQIANELNMKPGAVEKAIERIGKDGMKPVVDHMKPPMERASKIALDDFKLMGYSRKQMEDWIDIVNEMAGEIDRLRLAAGEPVMGLRIGSDQ